MERAEEEDDEEEEEIVIEKQDEEIVAKALARPWRHVFSRDIPIEDQFALSSSTSMPVLGTIFFSYIKLFISQISRLQPANENAASTELSYCYLFGNRFLMSRVQICGNIIAIDKRKTSNLVLTGLERSIG